ncbi:hypothetical protein TNCV_3807761 [Trichonephila clavipes]|nr:hypothetical protein TNCV_3807761 [Trichonephila clavipes]
MFKNCRKEDLRIVALELELIQYTIEDRKRAEEDRKRAEEDRKRMQIEEDRKKEAENRLREKELELELARLNVNSDNERTGEGCNTLDALVKSVRILTVKVPNRPEERKTVNRDLFALSVKRDIKPGNESRSFFRVHTGYFSNIPKCIKAEFIASWVCSQSSVVSSSQR